MRFDLIDVLVVEDDEGALNKTIDALDEIFCVINFKDEISDGTGYETIEKAVIGIQTENPEVVILDHFLKDGKGLDVIKELKKWKMQTGREPKAKFIVHSSEWRYEDVQEEYKQLGVTRGVMKYDFKALVEAIKEAATELQEEPKKSMTFHDLPSEERLELFYDHLQNLCAVDLDLQRIAEEKDDAELRRVEEDLRKYIEELRDFVLKEVA